MKNTLIVILAIATLALASLSVIHWRKLNEQKAQAASLKAEAEQQARRVAEAEAAEEFSQKQRTEALEQASRLADKIQAAPKPTDVAAAKNPAETEPTKEEKKNGLGFLAKMMDDPDMKKMMREQQRMIMDQLYNPLIKKLNLTPEETEKFKEMLADNTMKAASASMSLFDGGAGTNRTEMLAKLTENHKEFEQQIKDFLGEDRYQQYQDYQQTAGERVQLNQFRQQFSSGENAITDQQMDQLLGIMGEEKKNVATTTGQSLNMSGNDPARLQSILSGDGMDKFLDAQKLANEKVFVRAKEVLTPGQLESFGKFQENQLNMAKMGFAMARKFMAPEKPAAQ